MKVFQSVAFTLIMTIAAFLSVSQVFAQTVPQSETVSPHQLVQKTTDRVMTIIEEARGYYDQDPERFYGEINTVLADVVDFNSFARGVMGPYASKKRYMALQSPEEKAAFKERMRRFSEIFKNGLVQTYAKGLLAFNGNKIEILPPAEGEDMSGSSSVEVQQYIYGDAEKPYVVQYKLRKNRKGEWKLRNVTIETINLGKVYQSQFSSAARQYNGDIDKVIDNWSVDPTVNGETEAS